MTKELIALLDGKETGRIIRDNRGKLTFIYNEQLRDAVDTYPLFALDAAYRCSIHAQIRHA